MGKVSPPSIKYIIYAAFTADGVVEKPDVIGAVFGQTEGLLGEDLELRELQKKGKIGRIDVTLNVSDSKTTGIVEIPTSIDKAETAIIAAAIETIDRIGPCDAKFEIKNIEDVRTSKRDYIVERAKKLMENLTGNAPSMKELEQNIISHARVAKVREYGKELLAAGPGIESAAEI
ncbi:MAG: DNA primase, partial [Candidatus Pacearchaeota archaeon]|nr:DNA primase [Candidatus Pacearchaeota archaeon]